MLEKQDEQIEIAGKSVEKLDFHLQGGDGDKKAQR